MTVGLDRANQAAPHSAIPGMGHLATLILQWTGGAPDAIDPGLV